MAGPARGFGVVKGKATRVYVFRKGQQPYRSSTEGVAAQRDFYSEPSNEQSLAAAVVVHRRLLRTTRRRHRTGTAVGLGQMTLSGGGTPHYR